MKCTVNWPFAHDGKVYEEGETVELTEAQLQALGGSAVVTPAAARKAKAAGADKEQGDTQQNAEG
jgi:hypothetical protein